MPTSLLVLSVVVSAYTLLAFVFVVWQTYRQKIDLDGYARFLNEKVAGRQRLLVGVQVVSYVVLACWAVMALPWVDLFTFKMFAHFTHDLNGTGFATWFGHMTSKTATNYFAVVLCNIVALHAAFFFEDAAKLLRKGPIHIFGRGMFLVWRSAKG